MEPEIIPFAPEHLTAFEWRDGNDPEWARELARGDFRGYSGRVDGRIIGVAGVLLLGGGQAYAPVILSREIEKYRIWFHREVKRGFLKLIREHGLKYVYAWVAEDSRRDCRWIKKLGLNPMKERKRDRTGRMRRKYAVGAA